ncbi:hypothetical protein [Breoghania sp.]|uniref:hypothetical protein n=1 Tax=Breoghania sp. TaxID=2065378 RepID=UPI00320476F9
MEEAPAAYKNPVHVIEDIERHGLVTTIATLKPLVTFKKSASRDEREVEQRPARSKRMHEKGRARR